MRRMAFVEDKVDNPEHAREPRGELGRTRRRFIQDARRRALGFEHAICCAGVGVAIKKAPAMASVVRPQTSRSVRAMRACSAKLGWQQVKTGCRRSSSIACARRPAAPNQARHWPPRQLVQRLLPGPEVVCRDESGRCSRSGRWRRAMRTGWPARLGWATVRQQRRKRRAVHLRLRRSCRAIAPGSKTHAGSPVDTTWPRIRSWLLTKQLATWFCVQAARRVPNQPLR